MSLWGTTTAFADKPKFLPDDANAAGSTGSKEHLIAVAGGWGLTPGLGASGNDNPDAMPEVLVCVKNLALAMGNASVIGIDWADGAVADTGLFDIIITFDETVDITSAAWSANQTITNKAYILLSRVGITDMVEDSTMACMYYAGSATNQLTFRGTAATGTAAYLAFNGQGVGDAGLGSAIIFDGTSVLTDSEGETSTLGLRQEAGTAASPAVGDAIILNASAAATMTVNGALTQATTLVVDAVAGATLAVGQVITVKDVSGDAAAIADAAGQTGLSLDHTLTITAVASQTSVTISEPITVANNVVLLASADGGDEVNADALSLAVAGPTFATRSDISSITRTGDDQTVYAGLLEDATDGFEAGNNYLVIMDASDGSGTDEFDRLLVEDSLSNIATYVASGSSSGTAYILNGVTVTAA